jgi:hypothetical protein
MPSAEYDISRRMIRQKGFRGRFHNLKWRLHVSFGLFSLPFPSLPSDSIPFGLLSLWTPLPSDPSPFGHLSLWLLSLRPSDSFHFGPLYLLTPLPSDFSHFGLLSLRSPYPSDRSPFGLLSLRTSLTSDSSSFELLSLWTPPLWTPNPSDPSPFPHYNPFQVPILKSALTIFCKQSLKQNYTNIFRYTSICSGLLALHLIMI